MYKSPIQMTVEEMMLNWEKQVEDYCVKAVQQYGFKVDKEELRKALAYDRNQYQTGYEDALTENIPIEWVKKFRRDYWLKSSAPIEERTAVAIGVRKMLEAWEEENEKAEL